MRLLALPIALGLSALACNQTPLHPEPPSEVPTMNPAVVLNDRFEAIETNFVVCANGGLGEDVQFKARLHFLILENTDAAGGLHYAFHFQDAGTTGVGLVSGIVYKRVGVTRETGNLTFTGFPAEFTFVNIFDFVAPGPGNNFQLHQLIHVTVLEDGVTAEVVKSTVECR
jgi:hypothetical protein